MTSPSSCEDRPLGDMSLAGLLTLRGQIDTELRRRGVVRTASFVAGELLEWMVARAYGGQLVTAGGKSVDVLLPDERTVQVKARWLEPGTSRRFEFSTLDFNIAVVGLLDRSTYALVWAREIPVAEIRSIASPYRDAWRVPMGMASRAGTDITAALTAAALPPG